MSKIVKTKGVCGGDACVDGTRIQVWVIISYRKCGLPDAQLLYNFPSLDQDDLDAAGKYYEDNRKEIDDVINTDLS